VPPRLLNLELTESAYMDNPEAMSKTVEALQEAGFTIMMDDFGSGYSSLNTLKDIRVDVLKIDMKFLSGDSAAPAQGVHPGLGRPHGRLARHPRHHGGRGDEQPRWSFSRASAAATSQGYYYARPMPVRTL
jgi:EAL domain-containing protein (putative c-di-GMP-specific phosphodiesterase class I)